MKNKKRRLICTNSNFNGQKCSRFESDFNFLELNSMLEEGTPCDICDEPLVYDFIDLPKKPVNVKLYGIIASVVIIVGIVIFFIVSKEDAPISSKEEIVLEADNSAELVEATIESQPETDGTELIVDENPQAPAGTQTKNFSNGDRYVGEIKNGQMHGLGTYYYAKRQRISDRDRRERMAEAGDYIIGEWHEGGFVQGRLYDKDGNQKEVVIIGR